MRHLVVNQLFVTEVDQHPDVLARGHVGDGAESRFGDERPGRVARRVDDDAAGSRRDGVQNGPRPDGEAVLRICPREHRRRFSQLDLLGERRPVRGVRDHLVAGAEQRERRVVERLLPARGDDDLGLVVLDAVIRAIPVADRALQVGDAGDRRVTREIAVDRGAGRRLDRVRRREVGFAGAEIDDLDARPPQAIDRRGHFHGGRSPDTGGPIRKLHASLANPFPRRRSSTSSGTRPCTRPPSAKTSLIKRELI